MLSYHTLTQADLGLTDAEWTELTQFVEAIQSSIKELQRQQPIEATPPRVKTREPSEESTFSPGGWVGRYPGQVSVYPDPEKLNQLEYKHILRRLADWVTLWDVPIAAAALPILQTEALERRRVILGYSDALVEFTEEAIAHRPPVSISRETRVGPEPRGTPDVNATIQHRATGRQGIAYQKLQFSLAHPLNLLLVRFHAELQGELADLVDTSIVVDSALQRNQNYHQQFFQEQFPAAVVDEALEIDFSDPGVLDRARRDSPSHLGELVDIWEAYLHDQTLSVTPKRQLNAGLKPVEKVYELWVLSVLLEVLESVTGTTPSPISDNLRRFELRDGITLHYNRPLRSFSRLLSSELTTSPGRPDYALTVDDEVVWVGDAKFRPESNIGLEDYQRLLSYAADLLPAANTTATIFYVDEKSVAKHVTSPDYNIEQIPLKPKTQTQQRYAVSERIKNCLEDILNIKS